MDSAAREHAVSGQVAAVPAGRAALKSPRIVKIDASVVAEAIGGAEWLPGGDAAECYRVDNVALEGSFALCGAWFERSGLPAEPEWGYHATVRQATGSIIWTGFNASMAGKSHGTALGKGIYMADNPGFAGRYAKLDAARGRSMFICRTLKGGAHDHKRQGEQTVYVRDQQVLPVYLVHY
jgi:hypothetical protein